MNPVSVAISASAPASVPVPIIIKRSNWSWHQNMVSLSDPNFPQRGFVNEIWMIRKP